jgi:hypothetical protein
MRPIISKIAITCVASSIALSSPAYAKNEKTYATLSDIGAYGLATLAVGTPLIEGDTNGAIQAGGSIAAAQLVTFGLKAFRQATPACLLQQRPLFSIGKAKHMEYLRLSWQALSALPASRQTSITGMMSWLAPRSGQLRDS